MTTNLPTLIRDVETGPVTQELNDRVLLAIGWRHEIRDNDPRTECWRSPDGKAYDFWNDPHSRYVESPPRPSPLSNLQDATLAVPEGLTFQLGPGLNGGRLALVDEPEWFYRSSNPRPCLATAEAPEDAPVLVLAGLKAREREAEG